MGPRVAEARAQTFGPAKPGFVCSISRASFRRHPRDRRNWQVQLGRVPLDCEQVGLLVRAVLEREGLPPVIDSENALKLPVMAEAFARLTAPQRSMLTAMLGPESGRDPREADRGRSKSFARAVRQLVISLSSHLHRRVSSLARAVRAMSRMILVALCSLRSLASR